MNSVRRIVITTCLMVLLLVAGGLSAADGTELQAALKDMFKGELDVSTTCHVSELEIKHKDLEIVFGTGRFVFFKPVTIDGAEQYWAAYYEGMGQFRFAPTVKMEQEQLNRFFATDSLNRSFKNMLLVFSPPIYEMITESCRGGLGVFGDSHAGEAKKLFEEITKDENREYLFGALQAMAHPGQLPYLMVHLEPDKSDPVIYVFDPNEREEVSFLKRYKGYGLSFMETVCRYTQYIDPGYVNINGLNKDRIRPDRYTIDASISNNAKFAAASAMEFEVRLGPTRVLEMYLHPELVVDSITDSTDQKVAFVRYEEDKYKSYPLYVMFDRPLAAGELVTLKFFYHGDIVEKEMGQFFVKTGGDWYPRYGYSSKALFTLNFKTHPQYAFVAAGNRLKEEITEDTVFTTWKVFPPAENVSFNIGPLEKYAFEADKVPPVDIYFSKDFHSALAQELAQGTTPTGRNMQDQVGEDIIGSLKLFTHYFGPCQYNRLVVGEVMKAGHEAFPGFLHLGVDTWISTDYEGYQRVNRAHEVAHQWWGVGVGYETYHDTWLSEGFAEYSSLMYLQAVLGNDKFLDRVRDYRNDVFTARQYLFTSGAESGPIALGYRTRSSETLEDYGLVIYKKAALVLHMLRNMLIDFQTMNEDLFLTMMKEYYGMYRGRDVTTADFRRLTEKYFGGDMGWFFDQWIYSSNLPTYKFTYDIEKDSSGAYTAHCRVVTTGVAEDFMMYVPLEIEMDDKTKAYVRIFIDSPDYDFSLPGLKQRPHKLRLNPFESVLARVEQ
ncbi:MAG: M1 family aminopeptidase [Candidatus Zixiibacteriota bacterium]